MINTKDKSLLYLAILTFSVALIWVLVSAVASFRKSTIPADVQQVATPLNPDLNRSLFEKLTQRSKAINTNQ